MITFKLHTDTAPVNYNIPELSDQTLRDLVKYSDELGNHQPEAMTELEACFDPVQYKRVQNMEERYKALRVSKKRFEDFEAQFYKELEAEREKVAQKYGGWEKISNIQLDWIFDNLRYFIRDDDGNEITDHHLMNIPVESNDPNTITIYQLFGMVENLMGGTQINPVGHMEHFDINGHRYFLPKGAFSKNTLGEYIERQHLIMECERLQKGHVEALPKMIALLCRRGEKDELPLNSDERDAWIEQRGKVMLDLRADIALYVAFFFAKQTALSTGVFRISAPRSNKKTSKKRGKRSLRNTAGSESLIGLQRVAGSTDPK